ncbi:MAG: response regulator [Candidatus Berkelbacteria bacterium]
MPEGKKILVAEDEQAIAEALKLKLEHSGFVVTVASNGEEALEEAKSGDFDLIVLDLIMPKLDGFGFLEGAKKAGIETPVIVASNLSQPEDEEKAKALGAKDFYIKSNVSVAEIVEKIGAILE